MTGDVEIELFEYSGSFICHNNYCCSNMFGETFYRKVSPVTAGLCVKKQDYRGVRICQQGETHEMIVKNTWIG